MSQLVKFGLILGAICMIATLVLAVTYEVTKPKIDAQLKTEESSALKAVMPDADSFREKRADGIEYFEALKGGEPVGYCLRAIASGYNGYIKIMVGIDPGGVIKGARILEHAETPGLGAKINEVRPGEKEAWFLEQFKGKSAKTVEAKRDIDAVTGATISSKAVADAIRSSVNEFLSKTKGI